MRSTMSSSPAAGKRAVHDLLFRATVRVLNNFHDVLLAWLKNAPWHALLRDDCDDLPNVFPALCIGHGGRVFDLHNFHDFLRPWTSSVQLAHWDGVMCQLCQTLQKVVL